MIYVISKQGNRKLIMDAPDLQSFADWADAEAEARKLAKSTVQPWFIHQFDITTVASVRPSVEVKVTNIA